VWSAQNIALLLPKKDNIIGGWGWLSRSMSAICPRWCIPWLSTRASTSSSAVLKEWPFEFVCAIGWSSSSGRCPSRASLHRRSLALVLRTQEAYVNPEAEVSVIGVLNAPVPDVSGPKQVCKQLCRVPGTAVGVFHRADQTIVHPLSVPEERSKISNGRTGLVHVCDRKGLNVQLNEGST